MRSVVVLVALTLLAAGCGGQEEDATMCDASTTFEPAERLDHVDTMTQAPSLSADEKPVYFQSYEVELVPSGSSVTPVKRYKLSFATRDGISSPLRPARRLLEDGSDADTNPSVGDSGLLLVYKHTATKHLIVSRRTDTGSLFPPGREAVVGTTNQPQLTPYLLPDGSALYYAALEGAPGIYRARREGDAFVDPIRVRGLGGDDGASALSPVVSDDELVIYWKDRASARWYVATRPTRDVAFANERPLLEFESRSPGFQPSWLSHDRCRLYGSIVVSTSAYGPVEAAAVVKRRPASR